MGRVEKLTHEHLETFIPNEERAHYHINALKTGFMNIFIANPFSYALVEEGEVILIFGGMQTHYNTGEIILCFGINYKKHVLKCMKVIKNYFKTGIPIYITRLEAHSVLEDSKSISLLKHLGFSIIGIRSKIGINEEDFVLFEKIVR